MSDVFGERKKRFHISFNKTVLGQLSFLTEHSIMTSWCEGTCAFRFNVNTVGATVSSFTV